jgi:hypothetical protein
MLANIATFSVPKRGSALEECEDATWVGPDGLSAGEIDIKRLRIVVADGASESLLAGRWARRLASTFGTGKSSTRKPNFMTTYHTAVDTWAREMAEYEAEREERGSPIQWFEEPGLAKGAHSTVVIVEISDEKQGTPPFWRAAAIGDSCMFQVRNERLIASFPMQEEEAFSFSPPLLSSRGGESEVVKRHICLTAGTWEHGDSFYIATDALAAWFLRIAHNGGHPWDPLRDMNTVDFELDFESWVNTQRDLGDLHDDDTTLVRVDLY